jgi:hypothetical protein
LVELNTLKLIALTPSKVTDLTLLKLVPVITMVFVPRTEPLAGERLLIEGFCLLEDAVVVVVDPGFLVVDVVDPGFLVVDVVEPDLVVDVDPGLVVDVVLVQWA